MKIHLDAALPNFPFLSAREYTEREHHNITAADIQSLLISTPNNFPE